jgi:CBS domain-containing protein
MARKIKDVMHVGVETHAPNTPIATIAKTMKTKDVGAVPIVENDRIVGIVTDRDITVRALADGPDISKVTAKDIMTKDVVSCQETDTPTAAERLMASKRIRRLPVLDKNERLVGMVALGDISHAVSEELSGKLVKAVSAHHA